MYRLSEWTLFQSILILGSSVQFFKQAILIALPNRSETYKYVIQASILLLARETRKQGYRIFWPYRRKEIPSSLLARCNIDSL